MVESNGPSYTQKAFNFAYDKVIREEPTAVQISESGFEVWADFYNNKINWNELFERYLKYLSPMYAGIIGHEYLLFSSVFQQIQKAHESQMYPLPEHYTLYTDKTLEPLYRLLYSSFDVSGSLFEHKSAFDFAWALTVGWRSQQNFYDRIPKLKQMTLSEHILYEPNFREDRWFDLDGSMNVTPKLEQLHENTEFVLGKDQNFGPRTDFVVEVPVNTYLWTDSGPIMSWVQPDRVLVDQETGLITVENIKFTKPKHRSELEAIDWIQITLEALAARVIARKAGLSGRRRKSAFKKPLFAEFRANDLEFYLANIKVEHIYPNVADGNTFLHRDFTPTSSELAAVAYSLGFIANDLRSESDRNSFYKYNQTRKKRIEGITPKTMIVPSIPVQPIIHELLYNS